jgi:hypothetical protein
MAEEAEDGILNGIDVLIFIDEDVAELLVEGAGERRWPRRQGIAVAEDGEGHALKIGEVEGALGGFGFGIFGGEIGDEGEEGAREGSDAAEAILPLGGGEVQKIAEGFFSDGVFHGIDEGLGEVFSGGLAADGGDARGGLAEIPDFADEHFQTAAGEDFLAMGEEGGQVP